MALTSTGRAAVLAQETDEVFLELVEISHPDLPAPIRLARSHSDVNSNGNIYTAWAFEPVWPDSSADRVPQARVSFDNTDRQITNALRSIRVKPKVKFLVVRASDPNVVERQWDNLEVMRSPYNDGTVTLVLGMLDLSKEPAEVLRFNRNFKGLWEK